MRRWKRTSQSASFQRHHQHAAKKNCRRGGVWLSGRVSAYADGRFIGVAARCRSSVNNSSTIPLPRLSRRKTRETQSKTTASEPCCERRPRSPAASRCRPAGPCGSSSGSAGTSASGWPRWQTRCPASLPPALRWRRSAP